jgi:hypothetical protein
VNKRRRESEKRTAFGRPNSKCQNHLPNAAQKKETAFSDGLSGGISFDVCGLANAVSR